MAWSSRRVSHPHGTPKRPTEESKPTHRLGSRQVTGSDSQSDHELKKATWVRSGLFEPRSSGLPAAFDEPNFPLRLHSAPRGLQSGPSIRSSRETNRRQKLDTLKHRGCQVSKLQSVKCFSFHRGSEALDEAPPPPPLRRIGRIRRQILNAARSDDWRPNVHMPTERGGAREREDVWFPSSEFKGMLPQLHSD